MDYSSNCFRMHIVGSDFCDLLVLWYWYKNFKSNQVVPSAKNENDLVERNATGAKLKIANDQNARGTSKNSEVKSILNKKRGFVNYSADDGARSSSNADFEAPDLSPNI